ncbi:MAG: DegV family protein [Anaerolineaceae bacterium]
MLRIVTDSSADMPVGWEKTFGIDILPMRILFGERTFFQGVDLSIDQFYRMVHQHRIIPRTTLPSPQQLVDFYHAIAEKGDHILSIHVASKMSGTFNVVQSVARDLAEQYTIYPFDSGSGSAVLAYMCREARLRERDGAGIQEIVRRLEAIRRRVTVVFTLDTLDFAHMSGRVNALQAAVSSMLQIKPIVVLRDGLMVMADKVRTRKHSLERVMEMVRQRVGDRRVNIAVVHAQDPETAQSLLQQIRQRLNVQDLILTELSISVAANLGPGTVGIVAYPVEEDEEK